MPPCQFNFVYITIPFLSYPLDVEYTSSTRLTIIGIVTFFNNYVLTTPVNDI